jgi:hypothetical protein
MIKPFILGGIAGALAISIAGFSADWVVMTGSRDKDVQAARVNGQAEICATLVQQHRTAAGDATDLTGYSARDKRIELATSFAVALPGQEAAEPAVIKACSDLLNKRDT